MQKYKENLTEDLLSSSPDTRVQTLSEASSSASSRCFCCSFGGGVPSAFLTAASFFTSLCSSALWPLSLQGTDNNQIKWDARDKNIKTDQWVAIISWWCSTGRKPRACALLNKWFQWWMAKMMRKKEFTPPPVCLNGPQTRELWPIQCLACAFRSCRSPTEEFVEYGSNRVQNWPTIFQ